LIISILNLKSSDLIQWFQDVHDFKDDTKDDGAADLEPQQLTYVQGKVDRPNDVICSVQILCLFLPDGTNRQKLAKLAGIYHNLGSDV